MVWKVLRRVLVGAIIWFFLGGIALATESTSQLQGYAVLDQNGSNASQLQGYAVLDQSQNASQLQGYAVLLNVENMSQLQGYVILKSIPGTGKGLMFGWP